MAPRLHVSGIDAGTGEPVEHWIADGVFAHGPFGVSAELTGWVLPGLVDAHCHVGYSLAGPVELAVAEQQALTNLRAGVTVIRDCGSPIDTRPLTNRADLPVILRAGRHIALPKRYILGLGVDLDDPAMLPAEVAEQLRFGGGGWIKLVGDWIDRQTGDLAPLWPDQVLAEAVRVAHAGGARVTAHVFGEDAIAGLLAAGVDCLEHGTGLTDDSIDLMANTDVHLIPTLINIENFPQFIAAATRYPTYAKHMQDLFDRRLTTFGNAREAGIRIHAGTDAGGYVEHGRIADEVQALAGLGWDARALLRAVSHDAREWLGAPEGNIGDPADLVVYPADPALHLDVMSQPTAVIRAGAIVR